MGLFSSFRQAAFGRSEEEIISTFKFAARRFEAAHNLGGQYELGRFAQYSRNGQASAVSGNGIGDAQLKNFVSPEVIEDLCALISEYGHFLPKKVHLKGLCIVDNQTLLTDPAGKFQSQIGDESKYVIVLGFCKDVSSL
jgi:hypothetical protein